MTPPRGRRSVGNVLVVLVLLGASTLLLTRRAEVPLGALPCSLTSALVVASLLLLLGWFFLAVRRFGARAWRLPVLLAVALGAAGLLAELLAQLRATVWPAYDVVYLQPHPDLGWSHVPGLAFRWTGSGWWAEDFATDVVINSHGWRDAERSLEAAPGTLRVAVLGDSMIEALQVPLQETATQVLERSLRAEQPAEVLNFGVSCYGTGQSLLTYRHEARRYRPRVVVLFVAPFHLARTITEVEWGAFPETDGNPLWIRPTYAVSQAGALIHIPPRDHAAFVELHAAVLAGLGPEHARRRARRSWLLEAAGRLDDSILRLQPGWLDVVPGRGAVHRGVSDATLSLGALLVQTLAADCAADGARLVVADASLYFARPGASLERGQACRAALAEACRRSDAIHLDVSPDLQATPSPAFPHDGHFNAAGNGALAAALLRGVRQALTR